MRLENYVCREEPNKDKMNLPNLSGKEVSLTLEISEEYIFLTQVLGYKQSLNKPYLWYCVKSVDSWQMESQILAQ